MGGDTLMKNTDSIAQEMVHMTNAPEGRTYIDYEWVLRDGLSDYRRAYSRFPEDFVQVATPHTVPNGKWVMERPHGWAWLIGIMSDELETFSHTDKRGVRCTLLISDKPFGYIVADEEDVDKSVYPPVIKQNGRKILVCAQQVHKGELGQTVPIERLSYIRQALEPGESQSVRKRRKHGQRGWIRLTELATAANLSAKDIVFGFWSYSGHRNYWFYHKDQQGGQLLDIVVASSPTDIEHKCPTVQSTTQSEASHLIHEFVESLWVRRGFAYTILRLQALGVQPEVSQLA